MCIFTLQGDQMLTRIPILRRLQERGLAVEPNVPIVSAQTTRLLMVCDVDLTDTSESFGLPPL